jgi:hypothetical protein
LVPTIFALFSLAASCTVSAGALHAAECDAKPDKSPPQGEHWYYRTDRATKRQCWYLGPEGASVQKGATQASEQASDALAQRPTAPQRAQRPTAPQRAQRPTAPPSTAAPVAAEANVPAPAAPPPWPEAVKLPDVQPWFEPAPRPALAERPRSVDAIDPASTPASNLAEESQSLTNARSSPASAPAKATGDADHALALATIALAVLAISGTMFHAARRLGRRRASNPWPHPSTLNSPYPRAQTPLDFDAETPTRHISPPLKPLDQTERLAQALQQLLHELQTKHHILPPGPSTLPRSSRPPVATATRSHYTTTEHREAARTSRMSA